MTRYATNTTHGSDGDFAAGRLRDRQPQPGWEYPALERGWIRRKRRRRGFGWQRRRNRGNGELGHRPGATADVYTAFVDQIILHRGAWKQLLPRPLDDTNGTVSCVVAQVRPTSDCGCTPRAFVRLGGLVAAARRRMEQSTVRKWSTPCESMCVCEMEQLSGSAGEQCPRCADGLDGLVLHRSLARRRLRIRRRGLSSAAQKEDSLHRVVAAPRTVRILACADRTGIPSLGPERNGAIGDAASSATKRTKLLRIL